MSFIFAPTSDAKAPTTTRKIHIRRLYDLMQVCIQRNDLERAVRAWTILAHCKEINWRTMWGTSVHILGGNLEEHEKTEKEVQFLRVMMLEHPEDRGSILKELTIRLILSGQHKEALDELDLYLPSFPYQDDPVLHLYAGLISVYIAQPTPDVPQFNATLLRDAQSHFERAKALDPDDPIAKTFLWKIPKISNESVHLPEESDDDVLMPLEMDNENPKRKRVRT